MNLYKKIFLQDVFEKEMKLNPFSLSFCAEQSSLEQAFRDDYFIKNLYFFRLCIILSILFYGVVGILDVLVFYEQKDVLLFIRFGIVIPLFLCGFVFSFHKGYKKLWPFLNNFYVVLTGVGFMVMVVYCPPPLSYAYFIGTSISFIFGYAFIHSRFLMASVAGFILLIFLFATIIFIKIPNNVLLMYIFYLLSLNVLGMIICYFSEIYSRRDFFIRYLLEREKQKVQDNNENLEILVSERTSKLLESNQYLKDEIKERKELESRLLQAQKLEAIGTLAGGIAHDFNNILFPIMATTEMLLLDSTEDCLLQKKLNRIYSGAIRASELVKQILSFSNQNANELVLMKMHPIIEETYQLIRPSLPATIDIKQDIDKKCGVIKADPTQIHQILMNLMTNAYHAMENIGGELKITLKEVEHYKNSVITPELVPGSYACLTIADTGTGIDKVVMEKIFDPFFTTKKPGKGTGMGLSVVHGIVVNMKGAITVNSEIGHGTEFNVYLPVVKTFFQNPEVIINKLMQVGSESILLVDDEEDVVLSEKEILEHLGYSIEFYTSSTKALEVFRANPYKFDLVITDMTMPYLCGDDLSVELLKIRSDIPILICTGFSESMSDETAKSIGIKGFMLKPIEMEVFTKKIRDVLDKSLKLIK